MCTRIDFRHQVTTFVAIRCYVLPLCCGKCLSAKVLASLSHFEVFCTLVQGRDVKNEGQLNNACARRILRGMLSFSFAFCRLMSTRRRSAFTNHQRDLGSKRFVRTKEFL